MGRLVSLTQVMILLILGGCLCGCGSSNSTTSAISTTIPNKVTLSPTPSISLELGSISTLTASVLDSSGSSLNEPISYESSDPSVLTVASAGQVCAGIWNSLTNPTICTPGKVGVAQVTAVALGISSNPTTIYVHQHIDSITLSVQPGQAPPQSSSCFSKGQSYNYQATAYSRLGAPAPGLDITSTVGPFTWQAVNPTVVNIIQATPTGPVNGLLPGQAKITANFPGTTSIFVTADGVSSQPIPFETCLVQSISLAPDNLGGDTVSLSRNTSTSLSATVLDTLGNVINGGFMTWCSSSPGSVSAGTNNCGPGNTTGFSVRTSTVGGGAAITASCTPPLCNVGILPASPVYPPKPITVLANATTTSSSDITTNTSLWATTTGCAGTDGCTSQLAHIATTLNSGVSTSSIQKLIPLPATPNSLLFNGQGITAFLGTDAGQLGSRGLMVLNAGDESVNQYPSVVGKVLAVSPDGSTVVVSDTTDTPNQVYLFTCPSAGDSSNSTSSCTGNSTVTLNIAGATAAAFSSDGLKAYIVAGDTLYVYSKLNPLKTISLSAPVNDVTFLANGAFAYFAGGDPAGVMVRNTCNDLVQTSITTPGVPFFLKALPDGVHVLGVDPPGLDILNASNIQTDGCPPTMSNSTSFINLGQGNFVPTQLLVSNDGFTAYLLTQSSGSVLVFNIAAHTTSAIPLTGNVLPLHASLTPDGSALYVGASDGAIHLLDTVNGVDVRQIAFQTQPSTLQSGLCSNVNFPTQSVVNITAAAQSGSDTTYTYSLTSGPQLQVGRKITITGMANPADNGTFTITAAGSGTFTVRNAIGATASGQNGSGTVAFACNPDLVSVAL